MAEIRVVFDLDLSSFKIFGEIYFGNFNVSKIFNYL